MSSQSFSKSGSSSAFMRASAVSFRVQARCRIARPEKEVKSFLEIQRFSRNKDLSVTRLHRSRDHLVWFHRWSHNSKSCGLVVTRWTLEMRQISCMAPTTPKMIFSSRTSGAEKIHQNNCGKGNMAQSEKRKIIEAKEKRSTPLTMTRGRNKRTMK